MGKMVVSNFMLQWLFDKENGLKVKPLVSVVPFQIMCVDRIL